MNSDCNLTISLDIMGGDKGPLITIPAAILAIQKLPNLHLILCGDESLISQELAKNNLNDSPQLSICHTAETVEMDELPASALRNKKDSSMRKSIDLVRNDKAQACVSAGNTGALFSMAHYVLKMLPGVERPALISALPTHDDNRHVFMLDLGANVFCDSNVLYQFAIMGSVLAEEVDGIESPRVALLNMGTENIKGSDHIKFTAAQLEANPYINYIGFVEGNDILSNKADVIVCDGFVGNVALKTCEGVALMVYSKFKSVLSQHMFTRLLGKFFASTIKKLFKSLNPDQYNGASLIGLRGIVVKSHGNASSLAFLAAIMEAVKEVERQVPDKIRKKLEQSLAD
ncbi:phosphate acyltransferase PlsX [Colwellia sp. UCD-KL20]|uniref:phosphate acyltransferase PlsX n=1 Tax=Colwellia sp. UCD-KL20 TaxID=1917165 RepID=UPI000970863C|nr:phosphate acyltransferase PlsX [Colwellia sp. UCD-KL20]